jgi:hypothetical protein
MGGRRRIDGTLPRIHREPISGYSLLLGQPKCLITWLIDAPTREDAVFNGVGR